MSHVWIDYTNWKGVRAKRLIIPRRIVFGTTEYHPNSQWLLEALDVQKGESRTFAMRDIHSWKDANEELVRNGEYFDHSLFGWLRHCFSIWKHNVVECGRKLIEKFS